MARNTSNYNFPIMANNGYVIHFPRNNDGNYSLNSNLANPYEESSTPLFPIGTMLIDADRKWVYCYDSGAGCGISAIVQSAARVHAEQDDDIVVGEAAAIGAYAAELVETDNLDGSPNNSANDFAEGYMIVNDAAGEGQLYKIVENDDLGADEADCTFTFYDPLTIALTTSSECGLIRSPYYRVLESKAVVTGKVIGVPLIEVTASYYFWCQCAGPAPVDCNTAIALGTMAVAGTTAAQADPMASDDTEIIIGEMITPGVASGEKAIIFLRLGF